MCNLSVDSNYEHRNAEMKHISNDEILRSICKLKSGKADGKDGIGAEFYKHTCNTITPVLNSLFNKILCTGIFSRYLG